VGIRNGDGDGQCDANRHARARFGRMLAPIAGCIVRQCEPTPAQRNEPRRRSIELYIAHRVRRVPLYPIVFTLSSEPSCDVVGSYKPSSVVVGWTSMSEPSQSCAHTIARQSIGAHLPRCATGLPAAPYATVRQLCLDELPAR
jgi:hypothetical protein